MILFYDSHIFQLMKFYVISQLPISNIVRIISSVESKYEFPLKQLWIQHNFCFSVCCLYWRVQRRKDVWGSAEEWVTQLHEHKLTGTHLDIKLIPDILGYSKEVLSYLRHWQKQPSMLRNYRHPIALNRRFRVLNISLLNIAI